MKISDKLKENASPTCFKKKELEEQDKKLANRKRNYLNKSKKIIKNNPNIFKIESLLIQLKMADTFFKELYPKDSKEYIEINRLIKENKRIQKDLMLESWILSPRDKQQEMAFKLLADEDELNRLNNRIDIHTGDNNNNIALVKFSTDTYIEEEEDILIENPYI